MKKYYKDFYGATASIAQAPDGFRLKVSAGGMRHTNKVYATERGAKSAMNRMGDSWNEIAR